MAGWDILQRMVDDGYRPLVRDDLWAEVRAAMAERTSAVAVLLEPGGRSYLNPDEVAVRDPIGKITHYRQTFDNLCDAGHYEMTRPVWAKEILVPTAPPSWLGFTRYSSTAWAPSFVPSYIVSIYTEAGLPDWWTHALWITGIPTFTPAPPLPFADLWTDFLHVLNKMVLLEDIYAVVDQESDCGIITWYLDLLNLWDVTHLGGAAMDPVRVVFVQGYEVSAGPVDVKFELSGDGGATWEDLGTQATVADGRGWFVVEAADGSRWTADSVFRATGQGPHGDHVYFYDMYLFVEFDWDFKP